MKSLLIVTYCYPPCTLAPSWRVAGWTRFLPRLGWRPTILCRYWGTGDDAYGWGPERTVTREDRGDHEVAWVPYLPNARDRFIRRHGLTRRRRLRRVVTMGVSVLERCSPAFDALRGYRAFALEELRRRRYDGVLVTANPFVLFRIGHELHRRFGVRWAADYRDAWSTSALYPAGTVHGFLRRLDRALERRWVGSASFFTTVSPQYVRQIAGLIGRPGYTLLTGFEADEFAPLRDAPPFPELTVTYLGTLYPEQPVEVFLRATVRFLAEIGPQARFRVRMPGVTHVPGQAERVVQAVRGYDRHFDLRPRGPRDEALRTIVRSHLLLQVGYPHREGVVGSKIYEYMASGRPILVCPTDDGVLADMVGGSGAGFVVRDEEETLGLLRRLYREFEAGGDLSFTPDPAKVQAYSQEEQVRGLAVLLDRYFLPGREIG